ARGGTSPSLSGCTTNVAGVGGIPPTPASTTSPARRGPNARRRRRATAASTAPVRRGPGGPAGDRAPERRDGPARLESPPALLLVAWLVFLLWRWWEVNDGPVWIGYQRAMAEAGMVVALADWFAVTALFRRPLRLPIPHTAIIPTKKHQLGDSLGDFVGENFL